MKAVIHKTRHAAFIVPKLNIDAKKNILSFIKQN